MNVQEKQDIIDKLHYWDARVLELSCNYFGDEVKLVYGENNETVCYTFSECYKVNLEHCLAYNKKMSSKEMKIPQMPYFLQSVRVGSVKENDTMLYTCIIDMFPLNLEIWCKDILASMTQRDESFTSY